MKQNKRGFTLIELIIVIALLGALAVGLLAALDPFEQIKKGNDTGTRNTVSEIQDGVIRYYAIKQVMPWSVSAGDTLPLSWTTADKGGNVTAISNIIAAGELKTDFTTLATTQLPNIYMIGAQSPTASMTVCFQPTSKAIRNDPNTKYSTIGSPGVTGLSIIGNSTCMAGAANWSCYWCVD